MSTDGQIPQIDVERLAAALDGGAVVLDVRMPDEYEQGHVPGALLIPLPEIPDRVSEVPTGAPVHIICRSGGRSQKACEFLAGHGLDVANVSGGTLAWIDSGREIRTGPQPG